MSTHQLPPATRLSHGARGGRLFEDDLEQDQLVAFHARLAEDGCDATGEIAGKAIVETAANQQVGRAADRVDRATSKSACLSCA